MACTGATNPIENPNGAAPDSDGLSNLMEFALGSLPNDPTFPAGIVGSVLPRSADGEAPCFVVGLRRRHTTSGTSASEGFATLTVKPYSTISVTPRLFYRMRAERIFPQ
jgi:hypothetical protein